MIYIAKQFHNIFYQFLKLVSKVAKEKIGRFSAIFFLILIHNKNTFIMILIHSTLSTSGNVTQEGRGSLDKKKHIFFLI